jgi:ubiquitin-like 1-activating enzyme E1 B
MTTASSSVPHLLSGMEATLGTNMLTKIQSSKILLVGAGGIGCELLKNLALTGFRHVQVIDLDTIDVSNLNRQLLFRSQHVGMPKCTVACQVATQMVQDPSLVSYTAHHGNVCDNDTFNVQFVQHFDLTLNALDNVVARRRVNRLCLAAGVPLIEAGTTGYLGQVNVIDKESDVACYECQTQETQKVYPICTIRSTPSMPVHTIVWAKELYKLLFGDKVEESMLFEDTTAPDAEPSTYMSAVLSFRRARAARDSDAVRTAAGEVVTKLFVDEIQKQLDMGRYKTARKTPAVLPTSVIVDATTTVPPTAKPSYRTTDLWTPTECVAEFIACLENAATAATVLPSFDKDDTLAMRLVTASSNLRSFVFEIEPLQSFYSAKGIAGNIIPAIATTNAIAAGLQILQAFQVLRAQLETGTKSAGKLGEYCSYINCLRNSTRNGLFLTASNLEKPNPRCFVCRNATVPLALNVNNWTLQDLLQKIIKKDLGFEEPTITLDGDIVWEEGSDADSEAFAVNLPKLLPQLPCGGIQHGTVLRIEDFSQDLTVDVAVTHQTVWERGDEEDDDDDTYQYVLKGSKPTASAVHVPSNGALNNGVGTKVEEAEDDDDIVVVMAADAKGKRNRETNGDGLVNKRQKMSMPETEVIEIS